MAIKRKAGYKARFVAKETFRGSGSKRDGSGKLIRL